MKHDIEVKERGDNTLVITGAQLSYPALWKPGTYEGKPKPNLDASLIFPKSQMAAVKIINAFMIKAAQTESTKVKKLSQTKHPKLVPHTEDGEKTGGYVLKVTNNFDRPPVYIDTAGKRHEFTGGPDSDADPKAIRLLRAGNYVKVMVSINPSMSDGKVKVWTNLDCIQFYKEGPNLGGGGVADDVVEDEFGVVEGDFDEEKASGDADSVDDDAEFEDDEFEI